MGAHNTCFRFAGKQNLKLSLLHHCQRQNLQAETVFQQLVLRFFLDRLCRQNLKENYFLKEFRAKKEGLVKVETKWESFLRAFWIWIF